MLFGDCDCCDCACDKGSLPYTFTVEFSGLENATQSACCPLVFTSNFGSGAAGIVTAPGGCDAAEPCCTPSDRGPIAGVLLTSGGSCYAKCGRASPDLTITVEGVTGATFTPTFDTQEIDGLPYWYITGITATGGTGYVDNTPATIVPALGSFEHTPAAIMLWYDGENVSFVWDAGGGGYYYKEDCTLPGIPAEVTVTACGDGAGAIITPTIDITAGSPTFGQITALAVTDGGSGYLAWLKICRGWDSLNGIPFVLRASSPRRLVAIGFQSCYGSGACATVDNTSADTCGGNPKQWDGTPAPIHSVTLVDGGSGYARMGRESPTWTVAQSGWTFTPTFNSHTDGCGLVYWEVGSFAIGGSGSPLVDKTPLTISVAGSEKSDAEAIAYIRVNGGGTPTSVDVQYGGVYYRENAALPPSVASVTVVVEQLPGSGGSGASLTAAVESNTASANFGKIVSLTLDDGGSGYSYFGGPTDCEYIGGCRSTCAVGDPSVKLVFQGRGKPALVKLEDLSDNPGEDALAVWQTDPISDCTDLPTVAELLHGSPAGTVTITEGGVWDSRGQDGCGDCPCIKDLVDDWSNQPVTVTSDCPCLGGGTVSGSGTVGNFTWNPCVAMTIGAIEYEANSTFGVYCSRHGCSETGECQRCAVVGFSSYVHTEGGMEFVQGAACGCDDLAIGEDGFLTGTVTVTATGPTANCTVTITFG